HERLTAGANVETLETDMHFLKGAALNLGFSDFAELCKDGELRAAASDFGSIDVGAVVTAFNNSRDSFINGLAQRLAS
ncbi:MAG: Hpt domain-containing protein, partial [Pseudomonadota bacterium]